MSTKHEFTDADVTAAVRAGRATAPGCELIAEAAVHAALAALENGTLSTVRPGARSADEHLDEAQSALARAGKRLQNAFRRK